MDPSFDVEMPMWTLNLLHAGRVLATLIEEDIQACGNGPPHDSDCDDCRPQRDALQRWIVAVVNARVALRDAS